MFLPHLTYQYCLIPRYFLGPVDSKKAEEGSFSKDAEREGGSKEDPLQINIVNSSISELDEFASKREELKPMKKAERKKKVGAVVRQLGVYVPPAKRSNSQEEVDKRCVDYTY